MVKCLLCTAAVIGLTLGQPQALFSETIYYGFDAGAGPGGATPNADAADLSMSSLAGEHFILDFESASGTLPTLGYGDGLLTFTATNQDLLGGVAETTYPWASNNPYGFDTTEGTGQYFQARGSEFGEGTSSSITLNFSDAIAAFGAYFSSLESAYGATYISWTDREGDHSVLIDGGLLGQSVLFFGVEFASRVSSVTLTTYNSGWGRDIYGIDDIRIIVNPEPGSLLLLGSGLVGAGYAARRHRKRARVAPPTRQP